MANQLYDTARVRLLTAAVNWETVDAVLVAFSGTPLFNAADTSIANVQSHGATIVAYSALLTGKQAAAGGYAKSGPAVFTAVAVGPAITHFVLAENASPQTNSRPIAFFDDVFWLPFVPNGLDITVQPDWLAQQGWFRP